MEHAMTHEALTAFFGWFALINYAVMIVAWIALMMFRNPIIALHSGMTGVAKEDLPRLYFQFFSFYKVLMLTFGLTPYLVLRFAVHG